MKEYRIVVICHGKSRDEVEDILSDVHQATMRRDPNDEPFSVIESKEENKDWERGG